MAAPRGATTGCTAGWPRGSSDCLPCSDTPASFMRSPGGPSVPWLHRVRKPVLVLHGDDDPIAPLANARLLARLLPDARLVVLEAPDTCSRWTSRSWRLATSTAFCGGDCPARRTHQPAPDRGSVHGPPRRSFCQLGWRAPGASSASGTTRSCTLPIGCWRAQEFGAVSRGGWWGENRRMCGVKSDA